jgi:signal transduction histidine kinase
MSLRRLADVFRTTSFRLAVVFLALFSVSSLSLFAFLSWQVNGYLSSKVDEWITREAQELAALDAPALKARLDGRVIERTNLERPIALFAPDGTRLAGSPILLPSDIASATQISDFRLDGPPHDRHFRGIINRLASGDSLLIAQGVGESRELNEVLVHSMILGSIVTLALGLAGAAFAGAGAVRHIDAITRATESIVTGDLSRRLPSRGTSGDLDRLAAVVNNMLAEIERLMGEVKGVCDNIAHDLRTPLTRLLGSLERAQRRASSTDDYAAGIEEAMVETRAILKTFSALLRISEVEDGARRSGFIEVDLAEVTSDAVEFYEPFAEERGVTLDYVADGVSISKVSGDPSLLFEAFGNLIDNAIKFSPKGGRVRVANLSEGGRIGIMVSDSGPGIPMSEREAVLRRFHRTEKSRHEPGNGLGLSLVVAVARLHKMDVIFGGEPGNFSITLQQDAAPA